jgi:hypothetical protein
MNIFQKNNLLISRNSLLSAINYLYNASNYGSYARWLNNPDLTTIGTNGGPSYYGTYDQSGLVWEWTENIISSSRITRGGAFAQSDFINLIPSQTTNIDRIGNTARNPSVQTNISFGTSFRLCSYSDPLNYNTFNNMFVSVEDAGNPNNTNAAGNTLPYAGAVSYTYKIMKYLISNDEYVLFLNSIASTDTNGAYNTSMSTAIHGGINRSGSSGSYTYSSKTNFGNKPINYLSWYNAARYANWLCNNRPTGPQDNTTTEDGAYTLSGNTGNPSRNTTNPNTGATPTYFIPSENEWYKAAFYKGGSTNAGYWLYATQSDVQPLPVLATSVGDGLVPTNVFGSIAADRSSTISSNSTLFVPGSSESINWIAHGFNTGQSSLLKISSVILDLHGDPVWNGTQSVYPQAILCIYSNVDNAPGVELYRSSYTVLLAANSNSPSAPSSTNDRYMFVFYNGVTLQSNTSYWAILLASPSMNTYSHHATSAPIAHNGSSYTSSGCLISYSSSNTTGTFSKIPSGPWSSHATDYAISITAV